VLDWGGRPFSISVVQGSKYILEQKVRFETLWKHFRMENYPVPVKILLVQVGTVIRVPVYGVE
jgi:hypothetical protein